tara:strand:- start:687 stop:824 length:138 start_codon:yes stop_codon:yes gene_type:complete
MSDYNTVTLITLHCNTQVTLATLVAGALITPATPIDYRCEYLPTS